MHQPHDSLISSHLKLQDTFQQLQTLLYKAPDNMLWLILGLLRKLESQHETHVGTLHECNEMLAEIHWSVTPIIHASIRRNHVASAALDNIRRQLHQALCIHNGDVNQNTAAVLETDLLKLRNQMQEITEFEKSSVFKLFEIIAANIDIPALQQR